MRTIGLLGGMSWESTLEYYRLINEGVRERLGKLHSAKIVMVSVDFEPLERMQHAGDWTAAARVLATEARRIEAAGADFLLICTNTMHRVADEVAGAIGIPLVHIVDATADAIKACGLSCVGLLGTKFTMEQDFYRGRLARTHGIEVLVPTDAGREIVHRVIYDELCLGEVRDASKREFVRIMDEMSTRGAEGTVLGCTEIPMLVKSEDVSLPLFDTTAIHAARAVALALDS